MNLKVVLPILAITHAAAGGIGFFVAKSLLAKDPAWQAENKKNAELQAGLDQAASSGAKADASGPAATPPADFKAETRSFAIQSFGMSSVSFRSDAPLEEIIGTTTKVSGGFKVDTGDITKSVLDPINVEVGTLKTGNDIRDGHLQGEDWFHTEQHKHATFELDRIEAKQTKLWFGHTVDATLHGTLTIKGISKPVTASAEIGYFKWNEGLGKFGVKNDILRVKSSFQVKLSDYGMSAGVIGQKVAEVVDVNLKLTAIASE